jgi:hypothetical protein
MNDKTYMVLYHESLHKMDALLDELQRQRNAMNDAREALRKAKIAMTREGKQHIVAEMIDSANDNLK